MMKHSILSLLFPQSLELIFLGVQLLLFAISIAVGNYRAQILMGTQLILTLLVILLSSL